MQEDSSNNKHIDEAMNSLTGMRCMPADELMYDKVMNKLAIAMTTTEKVRILLPRLAAAAVLLIIINIASIVHFTRNSVHQNKSLSQVITEDMSASSESNF